MSVREFYDWVTFATVHPFPCDLIDVHGAMIMSLLSNVHRETNAPARSTADFLIMRAAPRVEPEVRMSEAARMRAGLRGG